MITVLGSPMSQPTRSVLWTCVLLGLNHTFKVVDVQKGDHLTAEFLKMNPNAKFPVIIDSSVKDASGSDFSLYESHAILRYLARKVHSDIYPENDLQKCAIVDAFLDWKHTYLRPGAAGLARRRVLAKTMKSIANHSMRFDIEEIPESREVRILNESLDILNSHLKGRKFVAGDKVSIADIALACEVEQLAVLPAGIDVPDGREIAKKYPAIDAWQQRMRKVNGYNESHEGLLKALVGINQLRLAGKL